MNSKENNSFLDDNLVYIDLFDDDLYTPEDYFINRAKYSNLRNTIRLQIMLAILFNKRICVPEQWALSSLTFLDVFEEVTKYYEREVTYRESVSEERTLTIQPPIAITFRERLFSETSQIALALLDRVKSQRRLRINSILSRPELEDAKHLQDKMVKILTNYIEGEKKKELFGTEFQDEIAFALGDTQDAYDTSRKLSKLGMYIHSNAATTARFHNPETYKVDLGYYTQNVKHVCFDPNFSDVFQDDRITQFREFWRRSEDAGYGPSDIANMWTVSEELDANAHLLITKMGRYCMHRALSRASQASYGSTFYSAFSGKDDDFDVNIIGRMRELELNGLVAPDSVEDFEFLAAKNSANYEPADKLPWPEIWREVSTFSRTAAWAKTRQELKKRFENSKAEEVATDRFWLSVFDEINVGMHSFIFSQSQTGEGNFDVAMNFSRNLFSTLNVGENKPAIKIVGTMTMLANMAGAKLDSSAFRLELKVTRGFRKAARFENSLRNINKKSGK